MTDSTNPNVKAVVNQYWDTRADRYDGHPQHVTDTEAVAARWIELLTDLLDPTLTTQNHHVLDVGCGTGFLTLLAARAGFTVTGIDQSPTMLDIARTKAPQKSCMVDFVEGDADTLPFATSSVDAVIERHVLWTMEDPTRTLREWGRVLRPTGILILVEGDWRELEPDAESGHLNSPENDPYAHIAGQLPLLGGRPAEEIIPYVLAAGFSNITVTELDETTYWEAGDPEKPNRRFAIRAIAP
ncbi:class I SAM-dependent methyltransferase [Rhodococcus baikonurensis]|uniref:class I SAM-dependent methyltransferase n=1 Tax=Rhodococcus erythropolis group TaxID=2840174 RepID=UPI001552145A|nr:class I SAM-dependent methyltransferase [Rhodococcus erythropolis]PBI85265.1 Malonyl-[acyl-carrier protein] O-methyltransferase [Rhodococcus erythropolis]